MGGSRRVGRGRSGPSVACPGRRGSRLGVSIRAKGSVPRDADPRGDRPRTRIPFPCAAAGAPGHPIVGAAARAAAMAAMKLRVGASLPVGNEGAGTVAAGSSALAQPLLGQTVAVPGGAMYRQHRTVPAAACRAWILHEAILSRPLTKRADALEPPPLSSPHWSCKAPSTQAQDDVMGSPRITEAMTLQERYGRRQRWCRPQACSGAHPSRPMTQVKPGNARSAARSCMHWNEAGGWQVPGPRTRSTNAELTLSRPASSQTSGLPLAGEAIHCPSPRESGQPRTVRFGARPVGVT
jgi:hypothetical protein